MKKIIAFILCVSMVMGCMAATAFAKVPDDDEDVNCIIEEVLIPEGDMNIYGVLYLPMEEAESYPLVICSHGFGAYAKPFHTMAKAFAENGYAVYAFDFIEGGPKSRSGDPDECMEHMSVFTEANDLSTVMDYFMEMDYIDAENIFLLGESQGGYISAYVAAQRPEDVEGLLLKYPAFALQDDCWTRHGSIENIPETEEVLGRTIGAIYSIDAMSIDIYEVIGNYKGDVMICHGDADDIVLPSYSEKAVEVYANATLHIHEGAKHGFSGDSAKEFIEEAIGFIGAHVAE